MAIFDMLFNIFSNNQKTHTAFCFSDYFRRPPMNTLAKADFFGVDSWTGTWELGGVTPMWTDAPSIGCEAGKSMASMEFVSYCFPSFYTSYKNLACYARDP